MPTIIISNSFDKVRTKTFANKAITIYNCKLNFLYCLRYIYMYMQLNLGTANSSFHYLSSCRNSHTSIGCHMVAIHVTPG